MAKKLSKLEQIERDFKNHVAELVSKAKELMYRNESITAEEAFRERLNIETSADALLLDMKRLKKELKDND